MFTLLFAASGTKDVEYGLLKYFTTIKNSIDFSEESEYIPITTISRVNMLILLDIMTLICDTTIIEIAYDDLQQKVEGEFKKLYYRHCNKGINGESENVPLISYLKGMKLKQICDLLNNINFAHNDHIQWVLTQYIVEEIKGVPPMDVAKMLEQEYKPLTGEELKVMRNEYPEIDEKFNESK
jgi:hypothetical protein